MPPDEFFHDVFFKKRSKWKTGFRTKCSVIQILTPLGQYEHVSPAVRKEVSHISRVAGFVCDRSFRGEDALRMTIGLVFSCLVLFSVCISKPLYNGNNSLCGDKCVEEVIDDGYDDDDVGEEGEFFEGDIVLGEEYVLNPSVRRIRVH
jgi:hypothetical protein